MADVSGSKADGYTFTCPLCGFSSTRWSGKKQAVARGAQHTDEHETGKPMPAIKPQEK